MHINCIVRYMLPILQKAEDKQIKIKTIFMQVVYYIFSFVIFEINC